MLPYVFQSKSLMYIKIPAEAYQDNSLTLLWNEILCVNNLRVLLTVIIDDSALIATLFEAFEYKLERFPLVVALDVLNGIEQVRCGAFRLDDSGNGKKRSCRRIAC